MNRPTPEENLQAIVNSPTYKLAESDIDFLTRPELRPIRMQLELLKPEMGLNREGVHSTIVVFGGTQIVEEKVAKARVVAAETAVAANPDDQAAQRELIRAKRILAKSPYYDTARQFGRLVSQRSKHNGNEYENVIVTGGGPGIMEAANRGAFDVGGKSIGLNITLPEEQFPNPYITPELCFMFHYFALRKMHFLMRAHALVIFPGGFGTLDELFDALTLRQTHRMQEIPIILVGEDYWRKVIDIEFLADEGVIQDAHVQLVTYAETAEDIWQIIDSYPFDDEEEGLPAEPTVGENRADRPRTQANAKR